MLGDNIIAYDSLETVKSSVKDLTSAVIETGNQNLKQTLIQMRNQAEQNHERLYHLAEQNGWYLSAAKATPQEVSRFNKFFQQTYQNAQLQQPGYTSVGQQGYTTGGQQGYSSGGQQMGQPGQQVQQGIQFQPSSQQQNY